jgi:hypothetical protein
MENIAREDNPQRGDCVIVMKGRKVKQGTIGIIIGATTNQWGRKFGILTESIEGIMSFEPTIVWTADTNVQLSPYITDEQKQRLRELFVKNLNAYLIKTGKGNGTATFDFSNNI